MTDEEAGAIFIGCIAIFIWLFYSCFVASRARKRGYKAAPWFFATLLIFPANFLLVIGMLNALRDRSIERKRQREWELLMAQLVKVKFKPVGSEGASFSDATIGEERTIGA